MSNNLFMKLDTAIDDVRDPKTLAKFVDCLLQDYKSNKEQWLNGDIPSFLEAMSAWIKDMDGYYMNHGKSLDVRHPDWKHFADILMASRIYE